MSPSSDSPTRGARTRRLAAITTGAAALALVATALVPATARAASPGPIKGGGSGRCIDVPGYNTVDGTQMNIWDCSGGDNQKFTVTSSGQLQVLGKCLDASGDNRNQGTAVILWSCSGAGNQRWSVNSNGTITGVDSGLCLDATGAGTGNGTLLELWGCNGGSNQQWNSSAGTSSGGGGTGGGGSSTCSTAPVDPQATRQAKNLLCYLYSQYGNHILSGQQQNGNDEQEFTYIHDKTGKYPAVRGEDILDGNPGSKALSWWNAGGIPLMGYHMGSSSQNDDGYTSSQMAGNISAAVTPGTADNKRLDQRLDFAASQLQIVQNGGGAVLFRPYHEAGGTWFWWSKEGGSQYQKLWKYTFNYMTKTKGLHNLIWLMPYDGSPQSSFYPGKAYVDVAGADDYANDNGPLTSLYNSVKSIAGGSIPIALHEDGALPDPDQLKAQGAHWILFNTWCRGYIDNTQLNPVSEVQKVFSSSYVVTRDEVPNLK